MDTFIKINKYVHIIPTYLFLKLCIYPKIVQHYNAALNELLYLKHL